MGRWPDQSKSSFCVLCVHVRACMCACMHTSGVRVGDCGRVSKLASNVEGTENQSADFGLYLMSDREPL